LARLGLKGRSVDQASIEPKLFLEFLLRPLLREAARRDYEHLLKYSPKDQLLDQKPGHDRLARPCVVSKQEPDARQREEVAIDRFNLMWQWVDDAGVDREERVELVRYADTLRLCAEQKQLGVAIERMLPAADLDQCCELVCG